MATSAVARFGPFTVTGQIFFKSKLSHGLVNLKPIVPGHVLVIPQRVAPRLQDLTPEEVSDLFLSVQKIGKVVEHHFKGQSLTIAVQDGPFAGQSVPHVHVHVLPRISKDFEPLDKIYEVMDASRVGQDQAFFAGKINQVAKLHVDADEERKPRTAEEMAQEANMLAEFFPNEHP